MNLKKIKIDIKKIERFVLILIIGAAVWETCFLGYKSYARFKQVAVSKAQQDLLTIAKVQAWGVEAAFGHIKEELKELADATKLQEPARADVTEAELWAEKTAFEEAANEQFNGVKIKIHEVSWLDANGIVQNTMPFRKEAIGSDYSKKGGVKEVLNNHQSYTGGFFKLDSKQKYISICEPIFKNKEFMGLVQAVILLDTLQNAVSNVTSSQVFFQTINNTSVVLVDPKARSVHREITAAKEDGFAKGDLTDMDRILTKMKRGEEGVDSYNLLSKIGEENKIVGKLVAFTPIRIDNKCWSMSVTSNYDGIIQPIDAYSKDLILGSSYFILSILFVGWRLHKSDEKVELEESVKTVEQLKTVKDGVGEEIDRRKKTEDGNMRLLEAIESSREAIAIVSPEWKIVYANDAIGRLFGYDKDELTGNNSSIFYFGGAISGEVKTMRDMVREHNWWEGEIQGLRKDGIEFIDYVTLSATRDENGELINVVATHRDITARRQTEKTLRLRYEFEEIITNISLKFINLLPDQIDEGIDQTLVRIGEFMKVDRSYIFQFSDDGEKMSNTHEWCSNGVTSHKHRLQELQAESFPWFAQKMRNRETVFVNHISELPPEAKAFRKELEVESIKSIVCVPMELSGELIGFAGFDAVGSEKVWTEDETNLLRVVGSVFANAIGRKRTDRKLLVTNQVRT
jgi:PAS domain S-box-containing protein